MLKRFKDSSVKKEKDVFSCMLRNLFEEYKFFTQYPEKELTIIAVLFGGIIEQGLVTYVDVLYWFTPMIKGLISFLFLFQSV